MEGVAREEDPKTHRICAQLVLGLQRLKKYIYTLIEYYYYWTYKNYSGIKFISINPELLE